MTLLCKMEYADVKAKKAEIAEARRKHGPVKKLERELVQLQTDHLRRELGPKSRRTKRAA